MNGCKTATMADEIHFQKIFTSLSIDDEATTRKWKIVEKHEHHIRFTPLFLICRVWRHFCCFHIDAFLCEHEWTEHRREWLKRSKRGSNQPWGRTSQWSCHDGSWGHVCSIWLESELRERWEREERQTEFVFWTLTQATSESSWPVFGPESSRVEAIVRLQRGITIDQKVSHVLHELG